MEIKKTCILPNGNANKTKRERTILPASDSWWNLLPLINAVCTIYLLSMNSKHAMLVRDKVGSYICLDITVESLLPDLYEC